MDINTHTQYSIYTERSQPNQNNINVNCKINNDFVFSNFNDMMYHLFKCFCSNPID